MVAALITGLFAGTPQRATGQVPLKPNIVFILTDDQRADTMDAMPATAAAFDAAFSDFVVTTSNCCPSRSTILTGQYVHNTRITGTSMRHYQRFKKLEPETLGPWLQRQGYYTGFIGKYFNKYLESDPVPPGWDEFYGRLYGMHQGNGTNDFTLREYRKTLNEEMNRVVHYPNGDYPDPYATRVFADKAVEFINRAMNPTLIPGNKPFALFVWTIGPNTLSPAPEYADAPFPEWEVPPSFLEPDLGDKPAEVVSGNQIANDEEFHRAARFNQLRQLLSIDDLVEDVLRTLDVHGIRESTWGIYSSDNGRFWGEHQLKGKIYGYEESIRVPLRMMVPGRDAVSIAKTVANVDLAPTIMAIAGDTLDHSYDGYSILPLIDDPEMPWRFNILIEHLRQKVFSAVRNERWTYIWWMKTGHQELYDRLKDPYQLENLAERNPDRVTRLRTHLQRLRTE
jgi:N-acetylglucosamine-6-sulfatase